MRSTIFESLSASMDLKNSKTPSHPFIILTAVAELTSKEFIPDVKSERMAKFSYEESLRNIPKSSSPMLTVEEENRRQVLNIRSVTKDIIQKLASISETLLARRIVKLCGTHSIGMDMLNLATAISSYPRDSWTDLEPRARSSKLLTALTSICLSSSNSPTIHLHLWVTSS